MVGGPTVEAARLAFGTRLGLGFALALPFWRIRLARDRRDQGARLLYQLVVMFKPAVGALTLPLVPLLKADAPEMIGELWLPSLDAGDKGPTGLPAARPAVHECDQGVGLLLHRLELSYRRMGLFPRRRGPKGGGPIHVEVGIPPLLDLQLRHRRQPPKVAEELVRLGLANPGRIQLQRQLLELRLELLRRPLALRLILRPLPVQPRLAATQRLVERHQPRHDVLVDTIGVGDVPSGLHGGLVQDVVDLLAALLQTTTQGHQHLTPCHAPGVVTEAAHLLEGPAPRLHVEVIVPENRPLHGRVDLDRAGQGAARLPGVVAPPAGLGHMLLLRGQGLRKAGDAYFQPIGRRPSRRRLRASRDVPYRRRPRPEGLRPRADRGTQRCAWHSDRPRLPHRSCEARRAQRGPTSVSDGPGPRRRLKRRPRIRDDDRREGRGCPWTRRRPTAAREHPQDALST